MEYHNNIEAWLAQYYDTASQHDNFAGMVEVGKAMKTNPESVKVRLRVFSVDGLVVGEMDDISSGFKFMHSYWENQVDLSVVITGLEDGQDSAIDKIEITWFINNIPKVRVSTMITASQHVQNGSTLHLYKGHLLVGFG